MPKRILNKVNFFEPVIGGKEIDLKKYLKSIGLMRENLQSYLKGKLKKNLK